nr:uncharacterized protein LOC104092745 isoform X1 [Nicotiana tomentosiformis]XP_033511140.1 uncharacterized protein LOC104092745 isoform X1 [Nicotiana tomentosiformis]XP_033511141.1 uncharacterized protein LOC104092745 isoform X1 [Nicotiana tomentosiformis]XP_033511142.1 uncharacterized protein LOC104092745 isoform X1 [Nicotiana tomentosiformis]
MFCASCFGYFLDLPQFKIQNQLIHCILLREVVPGRERELWVKTLVVCCGFGIGEFVVITGLKCVEEDATVYDKPHINRLLKEYFPGDGKGAITRGQFLDHFKKKEWKSDKDAFKMALMVFVHHFIFSDANNHGINKDDFDIIESGQYHTYAWGKKSFEDILKTMRDRQCDYLTMYRLGGLPLALQIWFFECCSMVDKHLIVHVGTNVPRILNWKVTETPKYTDLTNGVNISSIDLLNYRNISPTREEMSTQNIATLFEVNADDVASGEVPAFHTDNSVSESPPYPQNMEQQSKRPYPQNTEQQPKPSYDPSAHIDQLNAEVEKLRSVVGKLTYTVMTLNGYVVSYFEKVFSFLNMKETKQTREEVPDTKIRQCVSDDNTSGLGEYNGYRYDVVPDFVEQMNQDNTLADQTNLGVKAIEGVTDGVDHGAAGRCQG